MNVLDYARNLVKEMEKDGPEKTDSRNWTQQRPILYGLCDGALWVAICSIALTFVSDPVFVIWLTIEWVNGWRRQPGLWDADVAARKLDEIEKLICALGPEHQRFARLMGLWAYHGAIVYYEAAGQFDRAAACYWHELVMANSSWDKARAKFMACEAGLRNSFCLEKSVENLTKMFTDLKIASTAALGLVSTLDEAERVRWTANISDDIVLWDWLVNNEFNEEAFEGFKAAYEAAGDQKPSLEDTWLTLQLIASSDIQQVDTLGSAIRIDGPSPDWVALSLYVATTKSTNPGMWDMYEDMLDEMSSRQHAGHLARYLMNISKA